jgi:hypothetical protein
MVKTWRDFHYTKRHCAERVRVELTLRAFQAPTLPLSYLSIEPKQELESCSDAYKATAPPSVLLRLMSRWLDLNQRNHAPKARGVGRTVPHLEIKNPSLVMRGSTIIRSLLSLIEQSTYETPLTRSCWTLGTEGKPRMLASIHVAILRRTFHISKFI